jgi:RNA polymerase sigma factor (sigma-70 family)
LTFDQFLKEDYKALKEAAEKITGRSQLAEDLLHYAIEEMSYKENLQGIIDSGGARFYCVRIMMTQWRSQTGPFYKQFVRQHDDVELHDKPIEEVEPFDFKKVNHLLDQLNWYDRELFKLFAEGSHTYSSLSRETGIPRTSISLTVNRVRNYIKKHI